MTEGPYTQYNAAAGTVTVTHGDWSDTFDVAGLDRWIAFYRRLAKQNGAYAATLAVLEDAKGAAK